MWKMPKRRLAVLVIALAVACAVWLTVLHKLDDSSASRINALLDQLASADPAARDKAEDALGAMNNKRDIKHLVNWLGTNDTRSLNGEVQLVFAQLGERALGPVMKAGELAVRTPMDLRGRYLPKFVNELLSGPYEKEAGRRRRFREGLVPAIRGIQKPAIPRLARMLSDGKPACREFAVRALSEIYSADVLGLLIGMVKDPDVEVSSAAITGLGGKLGTGGTIRASDPADIRALARVMQTGSKPMREYAMCILSRLEDAAAGDALAAVATASSGEVHRDAITGLAARGDRRALPELLEAVRTGATDARTLVYLLGYFDDPESFALLVRMARDTGSQYRRPAIQGLVDIAGRKGTDPGLKSQALAVLREILHEGDDGYGSCASYTLGPLASSGVGAVAERLDEDVKSADPEKRQYAAQLLASRKSDNGAVALLVADLGDPRPEVRKSAADWLGSLGDPGTKESLRKLFVDNNEAVRHAAQLALWRVKLKEAWRKRGQVYEE